MKGPNTNLKSEGRRPKDNRNSINNRLIDQLVGASVSVGANFSEADDAVSGKDFKNKIGTCRKESKEALFLLRVIATAEESLTPEARELWREAKDSDFTFLSSPV